jgi:hypothetical protein
MEGLRKSTIIFTTVAFWLRKERRIYGTESKSAVIIFVDKPFNS